MYKFIDNRKEPATPLTVLIMNRRGEDVTEKYIPVHIVDEAPNITKVNRVEKDVFRTSDTGYLRAHLTGSFKYRAGLNDT